MAKFDDDFPLTVSEKHRFGDRVYRYFSYQNLTFAHGAKILSRFLDRTEVRAGAPPVRTLEDVIYDPRYTALYDVDGRRIDETRLYLMPKVSDEALRLKDADVAAKREAARSVTEPVQIDPSGAELSGNHVVFGGAQINSWGHHICDGMNRLWYETDLPTLRLNGFFETKARPPFIDELERLAPPRNLITPTVKTLFKRVTMPVASFQSKFIIYENADVEHMRIAHSVAGRSTERFSKKVFLSRNNRYRRRCSGEQELNERMRTLGFEVLDPADYSLIDQFAIFNQAEWVVGMLGSAFYTQMFTKKNSGLKLAAITNPQQDYRYFLTNLVKGHPMAFLPTTQIVPTPTNPTAVEIDLPLTVKMLEEIGAV